MKNFFRFGLLMIAVSCSSLQLWGQSSKLKIAENFQATPLTEVLKLLKDKYQLHIAYDNAAVQDILVNQSLDQLDLESSLQKIFTNTALTFQIVGQQQVLIRQEAQLEYTPILRKVEYRDYSGQLLDALTGEPLAYATIHAIPGNKHCTSDIQGRFSLPVPKVADAGISIRYLGYETKFHKTDSPHSTIHLQPQIHEIGTITVLGSVAPLSTASDEGYMQFNAEVLSAMPAFVGGKDLFRNLQLLPGIAAYDDFSAQLSVRGGNGDENMVLLDGITLYNVTHFFGVFSNVNGSLVDQVKIYKNAFPIEFGGRTASVVDISTKNNRKYKPTGEAELNFLTSSAYLDLPFGKNMNLMVGGRITNRNVANTNLFGSLEQAARQNITIRNKNDVSHPAQLVVAQEPYFTFYDLNAKWNWRIRPSLSLTASFFSGQDQFSYQYDETIIIPFKRATVEVASTNQEEIDWQNRGGSLRLQQQWSDRFQTDINLSRSSYSLRDLLQVSIRKLNGNTDAGSQLQYNDIQGTELNVKNSIGQGTPFQFDFGYHYVNNNVLYQVEANDSTLIDAGNQATQHALYGQLTGKADRDRLRYTLGLRATRYGGTGRLYFSPRLHIGYWLTEQFQVKGAVSRYHQYLRQAIREDRFGRSYEFWSLANHDPQDYQQPVIAASQYPTVASNHFMLGFSWVKNGFTLDVEAYQKKSTGAIEQAQSLLGLDQLSEVKKLKNLAVLNFMGDARTRGIDVLLKKSSSVYDGWIAYTLSKTEQRFSVIQQNQYFPTQNDRRHQLNWVNIFKMGSWELSGTYVFTSGSPYTDISLLDEAIKDRRELSFEERTSYLDNYHRLDLGLSYRFNMGKTKARTSFSVFNVFDHQNVKYQQYFFSILDQDTQKNHVIGTEVQMLGRTPNLSFSLEF